MSDYREEQMRSYAQHRAAHGDAKASHERGRYSPWFGECVDGVRDILKVMDSEGRIRFILVRDILSCPHYRTEEEAREASHAAYAPTAREELEADLDRDRRATGPDRAQEQRGRDLERP